jgi:hypothetical protein
MYCNYCTYCLHVQAQRTLLGLAAHATTSLLLNDLVPPPHCVPCRKARTSCWPGAVHCGLIRSSSLPVSQLKVPAALVLLSLLLTARMTA